MEDVKEDVTQDGIKYEDRREQIAEKASRKPITFDEDCPEMTEETAEGFREARKRKPYKGFCDGPK